jgi:hypothetical protein
VWSTEELAECYRVVGLLARSGLAVSVQTGSSDEGDPWAVVVRDDTGDVLVHLARIDGQFVAASTTDPSTKRGRDLRTVVEAAITASPLGALPKGMGKRGDRLLLHPATVLAGFIVTAWAATETLQARAAAPSVGQGEPQPAERATPAAGLDSRTAGRGAHVAPEPVPPSGAILSQAAAALATVAAATSLDASLRGQDAVEVDPETFVQAALIQEYAVRQVAADVDLRALQRESVVAPLETTKSVLPAADLPVQEAHQAYQDGFSLHTTLSAFGAAGALQAPALLQVALSSSPSPDGPVISRLILEPWLLNALAFQDQADSSTNPPPPSTKREDVPAAGKGSPTPGVTADKAQAGTPPQGPGGDLVFVEFGQLYEAAAKILRILPSTAPNSWEGPAAQQVIKAVTDPLSHLPASAPAEAEKPTGTVAPAHQEPAEGKKPSVTAAPVQHEPAAASVAQAPAEAFPAAPTPTESRPAPQPGPHGNAQALFEFTNDKARLGAGPEVAWTKLLAGDREAAAAKVALIFDAPWLAGKSFMLMPDVVMVEDDLLGGSARVAPHFQKPGISLDLGDGLCLKLLGMVQFSDV